MKKIKKLLFSLLLVLSLSGTAIIPTSDLVIPVSAASRIQLSSKQLVLIKGQSKYIKLTGTSKKTHWVSSNSKVAAVTSSGKVVSRNKGTATITAIIGKSKYKCTVYVQTPSLSKKSASLYKGHNLKLYMSGTKQKVTWKSSNSKVATVTKSGTVYAKSSGRCRIYATVLGKTYSCSITVKTVKSTEPSKNVTSMVWISATGKKYHRIPNCGRMNPSRATHISLSKAKQLGFSPCSKCF